MVTRAQENGWAAHRSTLDIVATMRTGDRNGPFPDHLRVFRNAEHGRLVDEWTAAVPAPVGICAGDLDEDGLPDVVAVGTRGAWLLAGAGGGWLGPPRRIQAGDFIACDVGRFAGDAHLDVLLLDQRSGRLTLRTGAGAGRLSPAAHLRVGEQPVGMTTLRRGGQTWVVTANAGSHDFTTVVYASSSTAT